MLNKQRQVPQPKTQVKTVTILLGFYFSALLVMVVFTGFFVYSNFSVPYESVASAVEVKAEQKTATPEFLNPTKENNDKAVKASK